MIGLDVGTARNALANLPQGTSHGEDPLPKDVYLPRSHLKAMDPNTPLVIGMRGTGKTFWWSALQNQAVRRLVDRAATSSGLSENAEVRTGFGVTSAPDKYPGKDTLRQLMNADIESRMVWRAVLAWQLAPEDLGRSRKIGQMVKLEEPPHDSFGIET